MKLYEAIAGLREQMGDAGVFLTSTGTGTVDAGGQVVPVDELAYITRGHYVILGTADQAEGGIVTAKSADVGPGTLTLSTPLVFDHGAQTPISAVMLADTTYQKFIAQATRHLSTLRPRMREAAIALEANTAAYDLPDDFISPDARSFDRAVGAEGELRTFQSYYAMIYEASSAVSANGFGTPPAWPLAADPYQTNPAGGSRGREYRFGRERPFQLVVSPVPTAPATLTFWYNALHALPEADVDGTMPDADADLMLLYARYLACLALSTGATTVMKYELEGEKIDRSKAPAEYRAQADEALRKFEAETRFRPIGITG